MTLQLHIEERRRQEMMIERLSRRLEEHSKCTHIKVLVSIASHLKSFLVEVDAPLKDNPAYRNTLPGMIS